MPGPAPDPSALRRDRKDDKGTWTILPLAGRPGDPPPWPLSRPLKREVTQWQREWARPQAVEWERCGQQEEVALYVRTLLRSESLLAEASVLGAVIRMQEALGISQPGLMRRRWKIEEAPTAAVKRTNDANRTTAKARFQVLSGEAAG